MHLAHVYNPHTRKHANCTYNHGLLYFAANTVAGFIDIKQGDHSFSTMIFHDFSMTKNEFP